MTGVAEARTVAALAAALWLVSCETPHSHSEWEECNDPALHGGGHGHGHDHGGGHDHGHSSGHDHDPDVVSITHWTAASELFVEYPPLVVNEPSEFAAHLTLTESFRPAAAGRVVVILSGGGAPEESFTAEVSDVKGIFRPVAVPKHAGRRALGVALVVGEEFDLHDLGTVTVYSSRDAANAARDEGRHTHDHGDHGHGEHDHGEHGDHGGGDLGHHAEEGIAFLKEQQWRTDFAMAQVQERTMRATVPASSARIVPRSDGSVVVSAPVAGRLVTAGKSAPRIGLEVEQGQLLVTIAPKPGGQADLPTLELDASRARAELDLASAARQRLEGLLVDGAVAERRVQEARRDEARARAEVAAANRRLNQFGKLQRGAITGKGGVRVVAPIAGTVVEVSATPGAFVEVGQPLMRVIDLDRLWLEARVAESNLGRLEQVGGAWFETAGDRQPYEVDAEALVAAGGLVDPRTRTAPFLFEVENAGRRLAAGMSVQAQVIAGEQATGPAIPVEAIVREGAEEVCFVQIDGESFARRPVVTGVRDGAWALVEEGLAVGERVVTRGAYAVKLAGAGSSVPDHGHVH